MKKIFVLIATLIFISNAHAENTFKNSSLVIDVNKLKVLHQDNAKAQRYPASLTKMMTLYLIFDALKTKKITMDTKIRVSKEASIQKPSKLGLNPGEIITVREVINGLIVKSANDAAFAIAEKLGGGNVEKFVKMMNQKAKRLGMRNTNFINPNGWHDSRQHTTAYDMAKLAISLRKYHPQYYKLFSTKSFKFRGKTIKSHNKLLFKFNHVDGIKTGFTNPSGFNLVTSVKDKKSNIVAVVMGFSSAQERDNKMIHLISRFS
jgi:D-alanyl-D-alanine carboxypeptidase (penicillin-binding protein 5/6)